MPMWNDDRTERRFVNATSMQSPTAACMTSGEGSERVPSTVQVGTKAAAGPFSPPENVRSTALMAKLRIGESAGHGFPGSVVSGGRPPVCVGSDAGGGGVV